MPHFRTRLRTSRKNGLYPKSYFQTLTYISSIIFLKTVMLTQIHLNHKSFERIIQTSICLFVINLRQFRNIYLHYPQMYFIDFVHNVKWRIKFGYQSMYLLKYVLFLSMFFLRKLSCFYIKPYYNSLSCSHIWIIYKLDTKRDNFFLNTI